MTQALLDRSSSQPPKLTGSPKASSRSQRNDGTAAIKPGREGGSNGTEIQIAAGIVPLIAEVNASNRAIYRQLQAEAGPDLEAIRTATEKALITVADIWKLLLGQDLSKLQLTPEAMAEVQAVIQRHTAPGMA